MPPRQQPIRLIEEIAMITTRNAINLATAAAMVAISGAPVAAIAKHQGSAASVVHCYGINTCKGTSDCKSYGHECKGQNECKGQGFKEISKKACAAAGGSLSEK
jgi:uncharacterized membrane protein